MVNFAAPLPPLVELELARGHAARVGELAEVAGAAGYYPLEGVGADVEIGFQASTDQWAREVVLDAWAAQHPGLEPTLAEIQAIQAVGRFEGSYGLATRPAAWVGSHNWGAVQCGHGAPCGDHCFETQDSHADGTVYRWCYKRYPSAVDGAADVVRLLTDKRPTVWAAMRAGSADDIAGQMRETGYHETPAPKYAERISANARELAEALGEPWVVRRAVDPPLMVEPVAPAGEDAPDDDGGLMVLGLGLGLWWVSR